MIKHTYKDGINISNLPMILKLDEDHKRNQIWFRLCDQLEATDNRWLQLWIISKMKELFGYER